MLVVFALARLQNRLLSTNGWASGGPVRPVCTCLSHAFNLAVGDGPPLAWFDTGCSEGSSESSMAITARAPMPVLAANAAAMSLAWSRPGP